MAVERIFRVMGSDAHVVVVGGTAGMLHRAQLRLDDLEARWSRFRPTSEISRLNAAGGRPVVVSEDTAQLMRRSLDGWRLTGGLFDPTMLAAVTAAGYDRSFDMLPAGEVRRAALEMSTAGSACAEIELSGHLVRLPAGIGVDPGGIGKGLAADLVAEELMAAGASGVCVNVGGDLRVAGVGPRDNWWTVSIDHPRAVAPVSMLAIRERGVATSTTLLRRWTTAEGVPQHHLIDPRTLHPSLSTIELASVTSPSAWRAEVLAKAMLLSGSARAWGALPGPDDHGLVVRDDASVSFSPGMPDHVVAIHMDGAGQ